MPAERRGQVIAVGIGATGNGRSPMINGRRQPSSDGTSRMTRECQVRICEGLEVQFLGPTRPACCPASPQYNLRVNYRVPERSELLPITYQPAVWHDPFLAVQHFITRC